MYQLHLYQPYIGLGGVGSSNLFSCPHMSQQRMEPLIPCARITNVCATGIRTAIYLIFMTRSSSFYPYYPAFSLDFLCRWHAQCFFERQFLLSSVIQRFLSLAWNHAKSWLLPFTFSAINISPLPAWSGCLFNFLSRMYSYFFHQFKASFLFFVGVLTCVHTSR